MLSPPKGTKMRRPTELSPLLGTPISPLQ
jgi:hypothetical protein